MPPGFKRVLLLISLLGITGLGHLIPQLYHNTLPQLHQDATLISRLLGETRIVISGVMLEKAEEYLHGGLRHAHCDHGVVAASQARTNQPDTEQQGAVHHHDHKSCTQCNHHLTPPDPWRWLNNQIHPQEHKHIQGNDLVELLPWLWAASRMADNNTEAIASTVHILNRLDKKIMARQLIEASISNNPSNPELEFLLGEQFLHWLADPQKAEQAFGAALQKNLALADSANNELLHLRVRTLYYLGYLALQQNDLEAAHRNLDAIKTLDIQSVAYRDLQGLLNTAETKAASP